MNYSQKGVVSRAKLSTTTTVKKCQKRSIRNMIAGFKKVIEMRNQFAKNLKINDFELINERYLQNHFRVGNAHFIEELIKELKLLLS